jgi:hypothetical protein
VAPSVLGQSLDTAECPCPAQNLKRSTSTWIVSSSDLIKAQFSCHEYVIYCLVMNEIAKIQSANDEELVTSFH